MTSLFRRYGSHAAKILALLGSLFVIVFAGRRLLEHQQPLPYKDFFTLGNAQEWKVYGGIWEIENGGIRNNSDERGAKLMTGSTRWRDYSVDSDILLLGSGGDAGLVVRASDEEEGVDSYSGYYAGVRSFDQTLTLGRADHGWIEYKAVPIKGGVQTHRWYHLRVIASGCEIAVTLVDPSSVQKVWAGMHEKNCVETGRIGLRSYGAGGIWKNIRVAAITSADLESLRRLSASATVPDKLQTEAGFNSRPITLSMQQTGNADRDLLADRFAVPIASLRFSSRIVPVIHTIHGSVVSTTPLLDVQDATGGTVVLPSSPTLVKVGDEVEVTGAVKPGRFSSVLEHAFVHVRSTNAPSPPLSITATQAATGSFDARYVELDGRLLGLARGKDSYILELSQDSQDFTAVLVGQRLDLLSRKLQSGSILRLRGVLSLDRIYTHGLTAFAILLRSADDVETVAGPPWWDRKHLVELAFLSVVLTFSGFFIYSRLEQWRLRAVLEERGRMAHDLHDTLSQSFVGIGFQLQAVQYELSLHPGSLKEKVDSALQLVRRSHVEARHAITTLRVGSSDSSGLMAELEQAARNIVDLNRVQLSFEVVGSKVPVPLKTLDVLFRVGQEAIVNAIRHSNSTRIRVLLDYRPSDVMLVVTDDGCGFETSSQYCGFGLKGMQERAASIASHLTIHSVRDEGTRVELVVPVQSRIPLRSRLFQ